MLKVPNTIFICEFCQHSYSSKSNMFIKNLSFIIFYETHLK